MLFVLAHLVMVPWCDNTPHKISTVKCRKTNLDCTINTCKSFHSSHHANVNDSMMKVYFKRTFPGHVDREELRKFALIAGCTPVTTTLSIDKSFQSLIILRFPWTTSCKNPDVITYLYHGIRTQSTENWLERQHEYEIQLNVSMI